MSPLELMLSESQERMLIITDHLKIDKIRRIFDKYELKYVILGKIKDHHNLVIRCNKKIVANMPSNIVANAPLARRFSKRPTYLTTLRLDFTPPVTPSNLTRVLLSMLSNPAIASKEWIYRQYDHEVGLRTILKPGIRRRVRSRLEIWQVYFSQTRWKFQTMLHRSLSWNAGMPFGSMSKCGMYRRVSNWNN